MVKHIFWKRVTIEVIETLASKLLKFKFTRGANIYILHKYFELFEWRTFVIHDVDDSSLLLSL